MFLFGIQHSVFNIIYPLAARHEDDSIKFIIFAIILIVSWAIQAISKLSKRKQKPPTTQPQRPLVPPTRPTVTPTATHPAAQATRLPPLPQLHQQKQAARPQILTSSPQRLPQPGQLRVAELLFANKLITPAQANRIRQEIQRRQGVIPSQPPRPPASKPSMPKPVARPAPPLPLPPQAVPPRVAAVPAPTLIPPRSTIASWLTAGTLRSQFLLAEALQPPLALRSKSHLP